MAKKPRQKTMPLGCVVVVFKELKAICAAKGELVDNVLAKYIGSHNTARRIRDGKPVRPSTLTNLLKYLGPQNLGRLVMHDWDNSDESAHARDSEEKSIEEWELGKPLTLWITTSNGLQFQVRKMRHLLLPETWGRGKCYDLAYLPDEERLRLRERLLRHPTVCRRLPPSPRIPTMLGPPRTPGSLSAGFLHTSRPGPPCQQGTVRRHAQACFSGAPAADIQEVKVAFSDCSLLATAARGGIGIGKNYILHEHFTVWYRSQ